MATRIQLRRGSADEWTAANPVLAEGETGLETDTGNIKYGDGVRPWAELPYSVAVPGPGEVIVGTPSGPVAVLGDLDPDRTISVVGDMHIGFGIGDKQIQGALTRTDQTFSDLGALDGMAARRIYVGDLIEMPTTTGTTPGPQDIEFLRRANALDDDWLAVAGNHDLSSTRRIEHWAQVYGFEGGNWVRDLGFCRIIGLSSDGVTTPASTLPPETLAFLDTELARSRKDTIIACHFPLFGTVAPHPRDRGYTSYGTYDTSPSQAHPDREIRAILDKYPQARIWLAGHSHSPVTAPGLITQTWTGSRHIVSINAGSPVYTDATVWSTGDDPPRSYYLTLHPDRVEVRVRNHRERVWEPYRFHAAWPERWGVPVMETVPENPAALLMSFREGITALGRQGVVPVSFVGEETYETRDGLTGLVMGGTARLSVDPRGILTPDTGSIVVRARFTTPATSTNYLVYHNPTTAPNNRLNIYRQTDAVRGQIGDSGNNATSIRQYDDTEVHTFGLSWREGWFASLHIDGVRQAYGRSSADMSLLLETIGDALYFGYNRDVVLYDVYLATRELSDGEHARLARSPGHWSWGVLDVSGGRSLTPDATPPPPPPNPTTMVATFENAITAVTHDGAVMPTTAPATPVYDTEAGRTGLKIVTGQMVEWDPTGWFTHETGSVVVRARFLGPATSTTYLVYHSPSTTPDHRINLMRGSDGTIRAQIGDPGNNATTTSALVDTDIHTFGINWRSASACDLYLDGMYVGSGSSAVVLTLLDSKIRTGSGGDMVLYEVLAADRDLTAAEHAKLHHASASWSLTTLEPSP